MDTGDPTASQASVVDGIRRRTVRETHAALRRRSWGKARRGGRPARGKLNARARAQTVKADQLFLMQFLPVRSVPFVGHALRRDPFGAPPSPEYDRTCLADAFWVGAPRCWKRFRNVGRVPRRQASTAAPTKCFWANVGGKRRHPCLRDVTCTLHGSKRDSNRLLSALLQAAPQRSLPASDRKSANTTRIRKRNSTFLIMAL